MNADLVLCKKYCICLFGDIGFSNGKQGWGFLLSRKIQHNGPTLGHLYTTQVLKSYACRTELLTLREGLIGKGCKA